ncbi:ACP S-malonyltransferase [Streptomyces calidiresistens]|uniref:Malonyl CoA-acyl carrier protein transacylase n=1 Tax=Streptomyces calidiresistens TaxID=1485586 RepID=A0A7W3XW29_9ACTN|nr:acyltransferase domain-containing protein [Streptomyces calidiresistens]MBB0229625.1 acyltransferase domain-containing protein [Streptomyces calidiresistens]
MLVLVAPGQGSQTPGFLTPWLDLPGATDRLRGWSEVIGLDLLHFGTEADAEEIRDTAVAQPLLVASALLSAEYLLADTDAGTAPSPLAPTAANRGPDVVAGHSVGELAAAAVAGVLSPEDALRLVRRRGLAMAEAAAVTATGMSAVLGGDPEQVAAHLERLGLTAANANGGGQVVAAGTLEQLAALAEDRPERARVIPLKVAGAFHTAHMAPAVEAMAAAAGELEPVDPVVTWVSNADGEPVASGKEVLDRLVSQVSNPVRWDLCTETFLGMGADALIELCPGGTLTGLAKRAMKGVRTVAVKTPDDLPAAREVLAEHSGGDDR